MKMKTRWSGYLWMLIAVIGLILLPSSYAHAYLDPGSGSFLFQILVAGFVGFLFMLRLFRDRVTLFFRQLFGRQPRPVEEPAED